MTASHADFTYSDRLVDNATGHVSRSVFSDEKIYEQELDKIFHRSWLLVGHESMVPTPGDFMTTHIGEDPIIVWRDTRGSLHAFLNMCPHRGNQVCLHDRGHTSILTCSYHGWCFSSDGKLAGVPFQERAYYNDLDKAKLGLVEVPRVQSYGGLIFASWDRSPTAVSLDAHLGELRWWLDQFLCFTDLGGLVALPGNQRYRTTGNWKIFVDNFAGDRYHTPTTHASAIKLGLARPATKQGTHGYFMAFCKPAHGLGGIFTDTHQYELDLKKAESYGAEVVAYVKERWRLAQERMAGVKAKPTHFSFGLCFPNFILQGIGGAFRGNLIGVCHPRGPNASEVQQWVLVERDAPTIVKQSAALFVSRGQSGAGMVGPDDAENFDRIAEITHARGPLSSQTTFHYGMGMSQEGKWPGKDDWNIDGLPGMIGPEFWEVGQRRFYEQWAKMMDAK